MSKRWEYRVEWDADEVNDFPLNEVGAEGWELVAVTPDTPDSFRGYFFKRPLGDVEPRGNP